MAAAPPKKSYSWITDQVNEKEKETTAKEFWSKNMFEISTLNAIPFKACSRAGGLKCVSELAVSKYEE